MLRIQNDAFWTINIVRRCCWNNSTFQPKQWQWCGHGIATCLRCGTILCSTWILLVYMLRALWDMLNGMMLTIWTNTVKIMSFGFKNMCFPSVMKLFLLTVLYNYSANWMSEIVIENAKVSTFGCVSCYIVLDLSPYLTFDIFRYKPTLMACLSYWRKTWQPWYVVIVANKNGTDCVSNALLLFYFQPSKYTLSQKQRCTPDGVPGIGWPDEGIVKYNGFNDLVKKDRASNGAIFNWALLSVNTERRRIASNKLPRGIALVKQLAIPRDD